MWLVGTFYYVSCIKFCLASITFDIVDIVCTVCKYVLFCVLFCVLNVQMYK